LGELSLDATGTHDCVPVESCKLIMEPCV